MNFFVIPDFVRHSPCFTKETVVKGRRRIVTVKFGHIWLDIDTFYVKETLLLHAHFIAFLANHENVKRPIVVEIGTSRRRFFVFEDFRQEGHHERIYEISWDEILDYIGLPLEEYVQLSEMYSQQQLTIIREGNKFWRIRELPDRVAY